MRAGASSATTALGPPGSRVGRKGTTDSRGRRSIGAGLLALLLLLPTGLLTAGPANSNPPQVAGPSLTFRTDASAADVAAAGGQVLATYVSFVVARGPPAVRGALGAQGHYVQPMPLASTLQLAIGSVDVASLPRAQGPAGALDPLGDAIRLVHFVGPIAASWLSDLQARGVSVLTYVPEDALLIRGPPGAVAALANLSYVDWIGSEPASWKVRPGLPASGLVDVRVVVLPGEAPGTIEAWLAHQGVPPTPSATGAGLVGAFGSGAFQWVRVRLDASLVPRLAALPTVAYVDPVVTMQPLNAETDWVIQTDETFANGTGDYRYWRYGLNGSNQVLGLADTGLDFDSPQFRESAANITIGDIYNVTDMNRRKVVRYLDMGVLTGALTWPGGGGPWDPYSAADCAGGHGTAVASTLAGNDLGIVTPPSLNNGNALAGKIYLEDIGGLPSGSTCSNGGESLIYLPEDYANLFGPPGLVYNDPAAPVRIHSDSWGGSVDVYDVSAWQVDAYLWSHPDLAVFFAVGNSGPSPNTVDTPATAKDVMAVGGAYNPDGTIPGYTQNDLASFSSRGPTPDGRIKPDILTIADGDSATSSGNPWDNVLDLPDHGWAGTSYATPAAAAAAAIVRQYFVDGWYPTASPVPADGFAPSAALLRAMLLASGVQITGAGTADPTWPNNGQGFGRILLSSVLPIAAAGDTFRTQVVDQTSGLLTGQASSYTFRVVPGASQVRFVLAWTDYPGTLGAAKALVNDLDLAVAAPNGTVYRGNNFGSFAQGASVPGGTFDSTNVEEAVILKQPAAGDWTVQVIGANVPVGPQPFALVATGGLDANYGRVTLDKAVYGESDHVQVTVEDAGATSVQVRATSGLDPAGELVDLSQAAPRAPWRGSIPLAFGQPLPDGVLEVRAGDTITVAYNDSSPAHTATATARVDGTPAAVADVRAEAIGTTSARIRWSTDEPTAGEVVYGSSPSSLNRTASRGNLTLDHGILLQGLAADTLYSYEVIATDQVGHRTVDTNGGRLYAFRTAPWGDVLLVIGDPTFPADRLVSYETALDALGWSWSLWNVSDLGLPSLPFLQARRAVLWQVGLEEYPTFNATARGLVQAYLDRGGRLFVASHDTAWSLGSPDSPWATPATQAWLAGVLKASFVCDPTTTAQMNGVSGDPITGAYAAGVAYTPHRTGGADDEIALASAGGTSSLLWTDSNTVAGCSPRNQPVGLRWVSSAANGTAGTGVWGGTPSRLVYFAFEITGIDTNATDLRPGSAVRATILDNAIRWLVGVSANRLDRDHPDVAISSPSGGVFNGTSVPVAWTATAYGPGIGLGPTTIEASPDNGQTWVLLANLSGATTYAWNVSGVPNGDAYLLRVAVSDAGAPSLEGQATTNRTFALDRPGGDSLGPVIRAGSARIAPDPPGSTFPAWINATADDGRSGNGTIAAAELFLSAGPPTATNGTGLAMQAADGRFDAPVEALTWKGALPLPPGPSCVWVHAQDAAGNWGPFNRTCFEAISLGPDVTPPGSAELTGISLTNGTADLRMTWSRAWDDGLYGGTLRYRILRASVAAGPYAAAAPDVPAAGNATYNFTDPGRGTVGPGDAFYRIETFDAAGNVALTSALAVKARVPVAEGENLLGLPVDPAGEVFGASAFEVPWTTAWTYDACGGGFGWNRIGPGSANASRSGLGQGFWFNASLAGSVFFLGLTPAVASVSLCAGWNLLALPGFAPNVTVRALRAATNATSVEGFSPAGPYYLRVLPDADVLTPGEGVWVYVPANVTWTLPGW